MGGLFEGGHSAGEQAAELRRTIAGCCRSARRDLGCRAGRARGAGQPPAGTASARRLADHGWCTSVVGGGLLEFPSGLDLSRKRAIHPVSSISVWWARAMENSCKYQPRSPQYRTVHAFRLLPNPEPSLHTIAMSLLAVSRRAFSTSSTRCQKPAVSPSASKHLSSRIQPHFSWLTLKATRYDDSSVQCQSWHTTQRSRNHQRLRRSDCETR